MGGDADIVWGEEGNDIILVNGDLTKRATGGDGNAAGRVESSSSTSVELYPWSPS